MLKSTPTGDLLLVGDFSVLVGNDRQRATRVKIGRYSLPNMNPDSVQLLDFCASLSITKTMFKHKGVHKCSWNRTPLVPISMTDLVDHISQSTTIHFGH